MPAKVMLFIALLYWTFIPGEARAVEPEPAVVSPALVPHELVTKSIRDHFQNLSGKYLFNGLVKEQILAGLEIPDPPLRFADGDYLISGCQRHFCVQKSAVIVNEKWSVLAVGLIYMACKVVGNSTCVDDQRLIIFVSQNSKNKEAITRELVEWAEPTGVGKPTVSLMPNGTPR